MRSTFIIAGLVVATSVFCAAVPQDAAAPAMASGDSIMVLPFTTAPGSKNTWIGKAIQQSVFTDLVQRTRAHAVAPQGNPPADQNDALRLARDGKVSMVVFGDVQESGTDVRITGQILDVATGNVIGALKSTGPEASLFSLEDTISMQVLHVMPAALLPPMPTQPPPAPTQQSPAVTQTQEGQVQVQPAPIQVQSQPNYDYYGQPVTYSPPATEYNNYNYYGSGYGYGYGAYYGPYYGYGYGYGYPYWGYPYFGIGASFVFTSGHDHHDDHHDGHNDSHGHNDWSHGSSNGNWNGSHNAAAHGNSATVHSGTSAAFARSGGTQNSAARSSFAAPHNASLARMGSSMGHMSSFGHAGMSMGHAGGSMGHMGGGAMGHMGGGHR